MARPAPATLGNVLDPGHMRPAIEALLPSLRQHGKRVGDAVRLRDLEVEAVHRRVVKYTLHVDGRGTGDDDAGPWTLVGKVYEEADLGRSGFDALRELWSHGFSRDAADRIHVPEPYAWHAEDRVLLMEDVPGPDLRSMLKHGDVDPETVALFARATAKLHGCGVPCGGPFTVDDYLAQRQPTTPEEVARAHPDLAAAVLGTLARARALHEALDEQVLARGHGDYHLGQPHLAGGRLWILDVDRLHRGDPMHDLAMVFVDLKRLERNARRVPRVRRALATFLDGYFHDGAWEAAGRIPLYASLIHLKKACKHVHWRSKPDWEDRLKRQVEHAALCVEAAADGLRPRGPADVLEIYERCPAKV